MKTIVANVLNGPTSIERRRRLRLREEELIARRNELMDVKPEPIPEPGSKSYAHLYPI
jgi:hypothetical protein